ncbi:hypothetical protein FRC17_009555 [Serendipita sp. 399]|nr:hypothetical protein FRC17_009555 [Serendipita sp. 399]
MTARAPLRDSTTLNTLNSRLASPSPSTPSSMIIKRESTKRVSYLDEKLDLSYSERDRRAQKQSVTKRKNELSLSPVIESDAEWETGETSEPQEIVALLEASLCKQHHSRQRDHDHHNHHHKRGNNQTIGSHQQRHVSSSWSSSSPSSRRISDGDRVLLYSSEVAPHSSKKGSLGPIVPIPSSGLSEEEELEVIGPATVCDLSPVVSPTPPIFLSEPGNAPRIVDYVLQLADEEEEEDVPSFDIVKKRKPPPSPSLSDIYRKSMICKLLATKPITPSLLSFTEETHCVSRRRYHPLRMFKTRYCAPESDTLRKMCLERRRLLRVGLLDPPLSLHQHHYRHKEDEYGRREGMGTLNRRGGEGGREMAAAANPYVFPRSGSLHHLRSPDSTAWAEDWGLGYVDLSFIHKSLFSFDLRMRMGRCGGLWAEDEEEILASFGRNREWEHDWERRWRVASWLMNYDDDEEEEDEEEDEKDE